MSLENRVVLVTGGGMSLGQVICVRFAKAGAKVAFCDTKEEYLGETAQRVRDVGSECFPMLCNVSDEDQVDKWISATADHFGRIDILVNNACVVSKRGPFRKDAPTRSKRELPFWCDITEKFWIDHFIDDFFLYDINVNGIGVFLCMRRAVPEMLKAGRGRIINIGSVDGLWPLLQSGMAYGTSKAMCHHLTRSAAQDLARMNITVNCIVPNGFPAHLYDNSTGDYQRRPDGTWGLAQDQIISYFAKRLMDPVPGSTPVEEVAAAAVYLADDETTYITGHFMMLDGGKIDLGWRLEKFP